MAEFNYDEVTHSVCASELDEELCRFETRFPERLSRLSVGDADFYNFCRHGDKSKRSKNSARYRTQPITFDEIAEVDEELISSSAQKGQDVFFQEVDNNKQQDGRESQVHASSDKENNNPSSSSSSSSSSVPSFVDDLGRQRRRRQSFRKLRNRHSVPEEISEKSEDAESGT